MVSNATNTCWVDAVLLGDATQIGPQTFPNLGAKYRNTLFGAKNAMNVQRVECVRHETNFSHEILNEATELRCVILFPFEPISIVPVGTEACLDMSPPH